MDIEKIISQMSPEDKISYLERANFWADYARETDRMPTRFVREGCCGHSFRASGR